MTEPHASRLIAYAAARCEGLPRAAYLTVDNLEAVLDTLGALGADNFQPLQFRYICGLLRRAQHRGESRQQRLRCKAQLALGALLEALEAACPKALEQAGEIVAARAELADRVNHLLTHFEFATLQRLAAQLSGGACSPLAELLQSLDSLDSAEVLLAKDHAPTDSLADFLRSQERELVAAHAALHTDSKAGRQELRSARYYRDTMQRFGASRLVEQSVAESHPESGPLNPQMLASQSLARMKALSPACSVRYVNYLQTLFALDGLQSKGRD